MVVGKAEMMAVLVDQHMADQPVQPFAALDPFDQDRNAIEGDAVGQGAARVDAALGERAPLVKAGQFIGVVDIERREYRLVGELLDRSEEHTYELQSLMRISYAVFCLKKKNTTKNNNVRPQYIKRI